jgi:DNA repair protein RecN (Recombination protein N)
MLLELHAKNFAVIRDARAEFRESFNVLTGETGAGKSLLIDALLALTGRGGTDYIRSGEETAQIEAVFQMDEALKARFEELAEEDYISLRKVISKKAKPKQYLNGAFVNHGRLKELLDSLLHVYGQSEAKELYDSAYHVELYDLFCDNLEFREKLKELVRDARSLRKELEKLKERESKRVQEADFLSYQVTEIRDANLEQDDEEEVLNNKRAVLLSREKILNNVNAVYELLYGKEGSVFDFLGQSEKLLADISVSDRHIEEGAKEIKDLSETVKNRAYELKSFVDALEFSEEDQNEIEERLDLIYRLKKKYGGNIQSVKEYCAEAEKKLEELKSLEIHEGEIQKKLNAFRIEIDTVSSNLSKRRASKTAEFKRLMEGELGDLGMPKAVFEIAIIGEQAEFPEDMPLRGREKIEFLFSAHHGDGPKPLSKIASGGELSRVMLAIKNVIPKESAMTVIFDEVDAGVGGKTAEMLGKKLKGIAKKHQVICITHLPQVAVWADHHLVVDKKEKEGRVEVSVEILTGAKRIAEVTRMLGGEAGSKGMEYAKELLENTVSVNHKHEIPKSKQKGLGI